MVKLSKEETKNYLETIALSNKMKSALKKFADEFPFKKRKNKSLYPRVCKFMFRLINSGLRQNQILAPIQFHHEDLEKILGRNYKQIVEGLIEAKIISTDNIYVRPKYVQVQLLKKKLRSTKLPAKIKHLKARIKKLENDKDYKSQARKFVINQDLLGGEIKKFSLQVGKMMQSPEDNPKDKYLRKIYRDQKKIRVNYNAVNKEILERIEAKLHLNNGKINYNAKGSNFKRVQVWDEENGCLKNLENVSLVFLKENYYHGDVRLIKNEKTIYYISLEKFKEIKTLNTYYSHMYTLLRWDSNKPFVKREAKIIDLPDGERSERLIRVHTLLCNTPSFFRKHMRQYGRSLKNLDIANSQFMFLTHCLNERKQDNKITAFANINSYEFNDTTSQKFFELSRTGTLYEYIAERLECSRTMAKGFCFAVLFDTERDNEGNQLIKSLFPQIHAFLSAFKFHHGYESLSKELQFVEASIIIDDIYLCHLFHLNGHTIHDSFFYDWKTFETMRIIVIERLNKIIGKGNYMTKIEG